MVQQLFSELFGIEMSVGSINRLRMEANDAVREPVIKAWDYVQAGANVNIDETSFAQGNCDGSNPKGSKGWLWVATPKGELLRGVPQPFYGSGWAAIS